MIFIDLSKEVETYFSDPYAVSLNFKKTLFDGKLKCNCEGWVKSPNWQRETFCSDGTL